MNKTSKITVKHFINTGLKGLNEVIDKYSFFENTSYKDVMPPPFYPLYIKITFQRATTQMKSLYDIEFVTIEEAEYKAGYFLDIERKFIADVIRNEYKKQGSNFILKGIPDKCKPYSQPIKEFFLNRVIREEYNTLLKKTESPYKQLLRWDSVETSPDIYYSAAIKLLNENQQLKSLKQKFDICSTFHEITEKNGTDKTALFLWTYGYTKEKFHNDAHRSGINKKQIGVIIKTMDDLIEST